MGDTTKVSESESAQTAKTRRKVVKAPRFSVEYMDKSVDPRRDFYMFANGKWVASHPVPDDKTRWGAFNELYDWNMLLLKKLADSCVKKSAPGSTERLVGDFYKSGMNTRAIEAGKFRQIEDLWDSVENSKTLSDLIALTPRLHMAGVQFLFRSHSQADKKNSGVYAFYINQGGLSLPDREYYLSEKFAALRSQYLAHVSKMFRLKGVSRKEADFAAQSVLRLETELASYSRKRVELRDQEKNYNKFLLNELEAQYPTLELNEYLEGLSVGERQYLIVGQPEFFSAVSRSLSQTNFQALKDYAKWHVLLAYAPYLHRAVESEYFDFFNRKLLGQQRPETRWKRVIRTVDECIGEALGKLYVEKHFPPEARQRMEELVGDICAVFKDRLASLPWMTEPTRKAALEKFERFRPKIGHPEKFRDYSGLIIESDDYAGNVRRSIEFEAKRQATRVGQPVDRTEWRMTPPTVNAYFSPTDNEIVFPAGILQPPFFDVEMDDAVNYGG
ncbi:MAG: M13 family metallopeptidase, partial [Thermoprotei archaeon]